MNWTDLLWVLLYFTVGWIVADVYDLDGGILSLLVFLGWPILVVGILVIFVLLFMLGMMLAVEEIWYGLFHRNQAEKEKAK